MFYFYFIYLIKRKSIPQLRYALIWTNERLRTSNRWQPGWIYRWQIWELDAWSILQCICRFRLRTWPSPTSFAPGLDLIVHTNHFWLVRGSTKCFEKTPKHLLLLGLAPQLHRSLFLSASLRVQSLPALRSNSTHIIFMLSLRYSHKLHIVEPFPMVNAEV